MRFGKAVDHMIDKCLKTKIARIVSGMTVIAFFVMVALLLSRVFICDQFTIKGDSMLPTFTTGDRIWVNKLLMGARIYKDLDFEESGLDCFRMPGLRKLRPGDIAVFNDPYERYGDRIDFVINRVFAKRCIACPGDTISVINGYYRNSSGRDTGIPLHYQQSVASLSDSQLKDMGAVYPVYPWVEALGWTIKNMGPLYVPGKGDTVRLDTLNARIYGRLIEYECGAKPIITDAHVYVNGLRRDTYTFRNNYYFFAGDNVLNSKDSRYIGLIPEEYIVGIVW